MLKVLHDPQEIETAITELLSFIQAGEKRGSRDIGFKGGYLTIPVYYYPKENLWVAYERHEQGQDGRSYAKHYFAYGLNDPNDIKRMGTICEINIPIGMSTAMIAGALGKDTFGNIFLVHTGKVGGGKPGVGQKAFWKYYKDAETAVRYQGNSLPKRMVMIGDVSGREIIGLIADFVTTVDEFKRDVAEGLIAPIPGDDNGDEQVIERAASFNLSEPPKTADSRGVKDSDGDESETTSSWQRGAGTVYLEKHHARVRNALTRTLKEKGYRAYKDAYRDILIRNIQGDLAVLFEVKSSCDTQSLYTAVGQLLVNSDKGTTNKILVMPRPGDNRIIDAAQAYGIETLFFEWDKEGNWQPNFPDIDAVIGEFPDNLLHNTKTD